MCRMLLHSGVADYYLVHDADPLPDTIRHWYLGVLRTAAPSPEESPLLP